MSAAFTKGPWKLVHDHPESKSIGYIRSLSDPEDEIAVVYSAGDQYPEREANARLLAAAPELLEALIALHAVARVDRDENYAAITSAAAVIAKATGSAT